MIIINDFIERCFLHIKEIQYICDNLHLFLKLSAGMSKCFVNNKINHYEEKRNVKLITYDETLYNIKVFLDDIDSKYFEILKRLIDEGICEINYDIKANINVCGINDKSKFIKVCFSNTLRDGRVLVHEFFHYLNLADCYDDITISRDILTETISIIFETLYLDFYKEHDVNEYYNQKLYRFNNSYAMNKMCFPLILSLICFKEYGNVNIENCEKICNMYNIKIKTSSLENNLKNIASQFSKSRDLNIALKNFVYVLGFSIACYIKEFKIVDRDYVNNVMRLNDELKSSNKNVFELLKIIDIDLKNNIDNILLAISKNMEETLIVSENREYKKLTKKV